MQVNPSVFQNRKAYLIKFTQPGANEGDYLGKAKEELLEWGFKD